PQQHACRQHVRARSQGRRRRHVRRRFVMHAAQRSGKRPKAGPTRALAANSGATHGRALYRRMATIGDGLTAHADPYGIAAPILHAQMAWLMHPQELGERIAGLSSALWELQWHTWRRTLGLPSPDPVKPNADDPRFADPV